MQHADLAAEGDEPPAMVRVVAKQFGQRRLFARLGDAVEMA
jgi:hypothetical protein